ELGRGAHHADGDLAAVGDQQTADTLGHGRSIARGHSSFRARAIAIRDSPIEMQNVPFSYAGSGAPLRNEPVVSCSYSLSMITRQLRPRSLASYRASSASWMKP